MNNRNIWDINLVKDEALKYVSINDFFLNSNGAYQFACRNNLLNEVCKLLKPLQYGT